MKKLLKCISERRQDATEMRLMYKCLNHDCRYRSPFERVGDNTVCPCCGGSDAYSDWYPLIRFDLGYRIPSWSDVRKAKGVDVVILACKKISSLCKEL